jgi:group I intron endonuclease
VYVYLLENKVNGKAYVGCTTKTPEWRWRKHVHAANRDDGFPLHRAIKKYGPESFELSVLERLETRDEMHASEVGWIGALGTRDIGNGYNVMPGGQSHTPESIAAMSAARCGRIPANIDILHSPEVVARATATRIKVFAAPEHREQLSENASKQWASDRERMLAAIDTDSFHAPEAKAKAKSSIRAFWADPEKRAMALAKRRATIAAKKE